jgi:hypothetical protein
LLSVKPIGTEARYFMQGGACREEERLRSLGAAGDLVKFVGMIAIIAVVSTVVVASLISRSGVVAVMPDWSERQLAVVRPSL